ncbi:hypothetical protein QQS21_012299 [Conoideocrella luteorostrata]|uniref:Rrn9 domain-containing protein n=1 Tax=Conoideocrella luteorostrata TaxID=1105319 RepID=A0AAJ0FMI0_9HYPO|nr:hypothetical protein QQS21_012299 [Conoideocrella luteorostrata]
MEASQEPSTTTTTAVWEDLDTDEIASVTSEDLYENRPNRWRGAKSTWRTYTKEERTLWRSMRQLVDQDLAVHLYDAFALKRQGKGGDATTARALTVKTDDGKDAVWAPPKVWTAWPLKENQVPSGGLFRKERDGNERFTLRSAEDKMPGDDLRDELTATVLRLAKERYRQRLRRRTLQASIETASSPAVPRSRDGDGSSDDDSGLASSSPSLPALPPRMESGDDTDPNDPSEAIEMSVDESHPEETTKNPKGKPDDYPPEISINDDLSHHLLRPSIRHILTKLDNTLTILHNARVAGLSYLSDSESSTEEDSDAASTPRRKVGRPQRPYQPGEQDPSSPSAKKTTSRRGRPRKVHAPREGETQEEMQVRVARESHRRLPPTEEDKEAAFEAWLQEGDLRVMEREQQQQQQLRAQSQSRSRSRSKSPSVSGPAPSQQHNIERKLRRWGLRNWSDVLGAAALAGFSPDVIARSTQRCANLFNQSMTMRRLDEQPASRAQTFTTTEYHPERINLPPSADGSSSDSDVANVSLAQRRIASRQASLTRSRVSPSSPASSSRRGRSSPQQSLPRSSQSPVGSRSRSRSRSRSSAGLLFCPVPTCDRAASGFSRRANLRRHLQLVHPGHTSEEDESDDEVVGAVHVDGFLKTIQTGRGWRGEDVLARKRKKFHRERGRSPHHDDE